MQYTISATALLAIIVFIRLRRRTEARSRVDETMTVLSAVTLGVLIATTPLGAAIAQIVGAATHATH